MEEIVMINNKIYIIVFNILRNLLLVFIFIGIENIVAIRNNIP